MPVRGLAYNITMRFRLRTLLIVLALLPPVAAGMWFRYLPDPIDLVVIALPLLPAACMWGIALQLPLSVSRSFAVAFLSCVGLLVAGGLLLLWLLLGVPLWDVFLAGGKFTLWLRQLQGGST